jgi:hypothetical protein
MSSSKCRPSRFIVSFIGGLVKRDTTSKLTIISCQLGEIAGLGQIPSNFSRGVRSGPCGSRVGPLSVGLSDRLQN